MRILLTVLFLSILTACSKQPLNKTWYVISDEGYAEQVSYRSIYSFATDSISIDFLGAKRISTKIQAITDSTIKSDSLPLINYRLKNDTLQLRYARSAYDTIDLRLLPFIPKETKTSIKQVESTLLSHNWLYQYEGIKFDATFLNINFCPGIRYSQMQVYYGDKLDRTLQMPLWKVESYKKQLILIIENPMDNFYANVFFINELTTEGELKTSTWQYGNKYEIKFEKQTLIDSLELLKTHTNLLGTWSLQSASERKEPEIDPNDTTYIYLGHIPIWGTINMNTVIEESDLNEGKITYNFYPDSSYQLLKVNSIVCQGKWELQRNGRVVKLTTESNWSDEYQSDCNDFLINQLTDEVLSLEHSIPIYKNDSTVPNRYYELKMIKKMHNKTYE